jgi:hypothetical protein
VVTPLPDRPFVLPVLSGRDNPDTELTVLRVYSATDPDSIVSHEVPELELDMGGVVGDRHYGISRPSNGRQARFYPRGTPIRNRRQLTFVSVEELADVARRMQLPEVRPEWLGANVLVEGYPELSTMPIGTRLLLPDGGGLVCEGVNQPCRLPARVLQQQFPGSTAQRDFMRAAFGRRGIAASVEHPEPVRPGARLGIALPELHSTFD